MTFEKILVCLLLAVAILPLTRWLRSMAWRIGLGILFLCCVGITFAWQQRVETREQARLALREKAPKEGRPGGFVASESCRSCHPEQYASWHHSFHRTMTQYPSSQSVSGNFDRVTLEFEGQKYHLERHGKEFRVDMVDPDWTYPRLLQTAAYYSGQARSLPPFVPDPPRTNLPISLLTGSHHMQAYWVPSAWGNMQFGLPFTYLFEDARWVPRRDVFMHPPDRPFPMQVWNVNCINCHATAGQPRQDARTRIIDSRAAEMGIACEACHGPGERHVVLNEDPARRYALRMSARGDDSIFNPAKANHVKASEACGQCHAVRQQVNAAQWNDHGSPFRPGGDIEAAYSLVRHDGSDLNLPGNEKKRTLMEGSFWSDGMVRVSGRDFNGMSASACFTRGELSCLSCHSMHEYENRAHQLAAGMNGNKACLQCHGDYAAKIEQHTHHPAGSSGSLCYNCHMPHTSYGLLKAIRSHQITSPTVQESLATGRPNACNACHLDRTLAWTGRYLNAWYGQPVAPLADEQESISAAVLWALSGDAGQRALIAWAMGWPAAIDASGQDWMAPYLAQLLQDPYAVVRYIAHRSLKRLPGYGQFAYDYVGPEGERQQRQRHAFEIWNGQDRLSTNEPSALLIEANGRWKHDDAARLLRQRNDRRMELLE